MAIAGVEWSVTTNCMAGWWFQPLWKYMKVSWDDYSQLWKNEKMFQTTNQMDIRTSHSIAIISLYLMCTVVKAWYTGPLVISLSWMGFLTVGILTSMKMDWRPAPNNSANNPPISSKSWYIPQKSHEFPIKSPFFMDFSWLTPTHLSMAHVSQGALVGPRMATRLDFRQQISSGKDQRLSLRKKKNMGQFQWRFNGGFSWWFHGGLASLAWYIMANPRILDHDGFMMI